MKQLDPIVKILRDSENILIATHVYPDGDALGSQLALGDVLESIGKKVIYYSEEHVSHLYDFLPGSDKLQTVIPDRKIDCAIALDCGDKYRLGRKMNDLLQFHPFIVIDHHAGHNKFGDYSWVEPNRGSTAEMIYDLVCQVTSRLSYQAAYCLYTAIVSDTGSFKYSATTSDTFRIAEKLVAKGIKPAEVSGKLFDNFSISRLELLQLCLSTLKLYEDNKIGIVEVTNEMFYRTGATRADTETFINYPRSLGSVQVASLLKESQDGLISVSLRSKGREYNVAKIAAKFNGGGHRNAAGFKVNNSDLETVREKLLPELKSMIFQVDNG
jgi:bifunctional oligoribonuclease and PAP phosphatase NrnA